jgi:DNA-binding winged helix-turn-helix (wHTH) protein
MTGLNKPCLRFGPFEVDPNSRELRKSGARVKLSGQPLAILETLLERPGQLVTREELRKRIWSDDTYVDYSHGLNAAVNKLREALCDSADDPKYIETLPRRGYRFIAPVENLTASVPAAPPAFAPPSVPSEPVWKGSLAHEEWEATVPVRRQTVVRVSASLVVLLFVALGMTVLWFERAPSGKETEVRATRTAELSEAEQKEPRAKEALGDMVANLPSAPLASQVAPAPARRRITSKPSDSDNSMILRLERLGQLLQLSNENSISENPAILHFDLAHGTEANAVTRVIAGPESIGGPQPSPDGKTLVFMAGHNESMDIWVCNPDGSSPKQLTSLGKTGTPRWSPDSKWIVFDSDGRYGHSGIYVISAQGGAVRTVVDDQSNNSVPSWSRDGKFIYFASSRGSGWDEDQVWKVPADGFGKPFQVTRQGGFAPYESVDGQTLYYAKSRYQNPEIWQIPANGGTESRVPLLLPSTWASWALTNKGILLLSGYTGQVSELQYYDFATHGIHPLASLERASFWLSASANGSSVWYSELTDRQAHQVFKASLF